jgi:hypothetical protein
MYRYTFTSSVTLVAAFVLCISLLLQPVANVYAQEPDMETVLIEVQSGTQSPAVAAVEVTKVPAEPDVVESAIAVEEIFDTSSVPKNTKITEGAPTTTDQIEAISTDDSDPAATTTDQLSELTASTSATSSTDEVADEGDTTNTDNELSGTEDNDQVTNDGDSEPVIENESEPNATATTTAQELDEDETTASSSSEELEPTVQAVSVVHSDQAIAFNRNECTEVSDGSFYCQKLSLEELPKDALFAAPDNTGDMEIYVVQDGIETQLTQNDMEDAAPYFDSRSNTVVWHRLINDRYQIISYDVESGTETQLTDTRVNNMEPTRSGQYTVWQRWVTDNWEIILFDGEVEVQLTNSEKHDIAPHINGDLIIWNVRANDGTQSLMTYAISTQNFNQISDTEGVSVVNPRMLVMYEAQYQNGDSVMKGFDLVTGEIVPLEHLPRELPSDLPQPDATGENRALPSTSSDEDELEQQEPEPDSGQPPVPKSPTVSTTTVTTTTIEVSPDLDLRPIKNPIATTTDLVVQQAAIPDVIIPAFEATSTDSTASSTQDT